MSKQSPTIKLLHRVDPAKLASVTDEMRALGAPTIRAVWDDANGIWHAAEGTHRLTAARQLGLAPALTEVSWDAAADLLNAESGSCWTGEELREACIGRGQVFLDFASDLEVA